MKEGLFSDMSMAEYRKLSALSRTGLTHFRRSPAHYRAYREKGYKASPEMIFGQCVDLRLFEPEKYKDRVVADQTINHNRNDYKEWKAEQIAHGRIILRGKRDPHKKPHSMEDVEAMVGVLLDQDRKTKEKFLSRKGHSQVVGVFTWPGTEVPCKIRIDWLPHVDTGETRVIIDYKTAANAKDGMDFKSFPRAAYNHLYHWQAAMYCQGMSILTGEEWRDYRLIVQEPEPPHGVAYYQYERGWIERTIEKLDEQVRAFETCLLRNDYPGYSTGLNILEQPSWDD